MRILALDASTKQYSVALSENGCVKFYRNIGTQKKLSQTVLQTIDQMLEKAKISLHDLDGFAVGTGPGAFTSLRVSLSTIKALALVAQKPIVGVSSLDVLANSVKEDNVSICVITDARREMVYGCEYQKFAKSLRRIGEYQLIDIKTFLKSVKNQSVFVGDAVKIYKNELAASRKLISVSEDKINFPQAKYLLPLAYSKLEKKQYDDAAKLVPMYLYPEDCQVTKKG